MGAPGDRVAAAILAAGRSRRMGCQKLLLPFGDKPLIVRVADEVLRAGATPVIVVTGADHGRMAEVLADRAVRLVRNPDPDRGMLESVRHGMRSVRGECDWLLVVPADHPGLHAEVAMRLLEARRNTDRTILVPVHEGRRGHPLLVHARHFEEVLGWEDVGASGLNRLLRTHPGEEREVPLADPCVTADMDVPEDYDTWRRALGG